MADWSLSENTAQAGDVIAFSVRNDVVYPAGFDVLQLPEGVTLEHVEQDTAETHRTNLLRKLTLPTHTELVRFAISRGLLPVTQ